MRLQQSCEAIRQCADLVFKTVFRHCHRVEAHVEYRYRGSEQSALFREDITSHRRHLDDTKLRLTSALKQLLTVNSLYDDDLSDNSHRHHEHQHVDKQHTPHIAKIHLTHYFFTLLLIVIFFKGSTDSFIPLFFNIFASSDCFVILVISDLL